MPQYYYVYIATNKIHTVLYTGVTNNLLKRIFEHRIKINPSFTSKYNVHKLVYYEVFDRIEDAIAREKQIKSWKREWKFKLILKINPFLKDLCNS